MWLIFYLLAFICWIDNKQVMGSVAIIGSIVCWLVQQGVIA